MEQLSRSGKEMVQETEIVDKLFEFANHSDFVGRKGIAYQKDVELKTKNYFLRSAALPVKSVSLPPPEGYMFKKDGSLIKIPPDSSMMLTALSSSSEEEYGS